MRSAIRCSGVDSLKLVMVQWITLTLATILVICSLTQAAPEVFTNSFYVKLTGKHGHETAREISKRTGFEYVGPVSLLSIFI